MSTLQTKIDAIELEIESYKNERMGATSNEDKNKLLDAIIEARKTLNDFRNQQREERAGKFYKFIFYILYFIFYILYFIFVYFIPIRSFIRSYTVVH